MGPATEEFVIQRSQDRYHADHGWLNTYHSFSFDQYYDPSNLYWGALRVLNDDTIAGGTGFPMHPHRDMEIITYVLAGELEHEDSMGNRGVVGPGGVQYMSAGTGVRHSEVNHSKTKPLHLVQMWILPGRKGLKPAYGQVDFKAADRFNKWLLVASGVPQERAPVTLSQTASFRVAKLENGVLDHSFDDDRLGFLFLAEGHVIANGWRLEAGDAARIKSTRSIALSGSGELLLWDLPTTVDESGA